MKLVNFIELLCKNNFVKSDNFEKVKKCYWTISLSERVPHDKWEDFNLFETYQLFIGYNGFIFTRSVNYLVEFDFLYSAYECNDNVICESKSGICDRYTHPVNVFEKFFIKNIDLFIIHNDSSIIIHPNDFFRLN